MIEMEDFSVMLGQLGMYFGTVVLGIFIHGFIVLPVLYTVFTRKLPFRFLANMSQAYITAFATASRSVVGRPWQRKAMVVLISLNSLIKFIFLTSADSGRRKLIK